MFDNGTSTGSVGPNSARPDGSTPEQLDPDWIAAAVDRFEGPLLRYTQRLTGDLETARDVVQEAFLRLCREEPAKVDGHLARWLYTVCRRRALDVLKKESRMKNSTGAVVVDRPANDSAAETAERHETTTQVLELLDRLPANQQEVVRLKFQAGLSYREISTITGLSVTNVSYLIHTAENLPPAPPACWSPAFPHKSTRHSASEPWSLSPRCTFRKAMQRITDRNERAYGRDHHYCCHHTPWG